MEIIIDGQRIDSAEQLYRTLGEQLELPVYFGNNLDALYDVLTEFSRPLEVRMWNEPMLDQKLGSYAARLRRMLRDAAGNNRRLVLVREEREQENNY